MLLIMTELLQLRLEPFNVVVGCWLSAAAAAAAMNNGCLNNLLEEL